MIRTIRYAFLAALCQFTQLVSPSNASEVIVRRVLEADSTISGQPIVLPQGDVQLLVSTYEIAPGASLPEHQHPFMRYGYVLEGVLAVTNLETGVTRTFKAGECVVESLGQWHKGANPGSGPLKILVFDQVPRGRTNTVSR